MMRDFIDKLFLFIGYVRNPVRNLKGKTDVETQYVILETLSEIFDDVHPSIVKEVLCHFLGRYIYFSSSGIKHMQHCIDVAFYNVCKGINFTSENMNDDLRVETTPPFSDISDQQDTFH